jgi:hypothetical protein
MLIPMPGSRDEWAASGLAIRIDLTQGQFTIVDREIYDRITAMRWFAARARDAFYAHHTGYDAGQNITVRMHRVVAFAPPGIFVDHINGDTLDNRAANLRLCTAGENSRNSIKKRPAKSRYKGVSISNTGNRWVTNIHHDGKLHFVGSFIFEIDAAAAYDREARKHFGEFARLNFPGAAECP